MLHIKNNFLFGITLFAYSTIVSPASSAETLKIGVLLPTSGSGASYGIPAINGVILAIKEINESGGLNGKKVLLQYGTIDALCIILLMIIMVIED